MDMKLNSWLKSIPLMLLLISLQVNAIPTVSNEPLEDATFYPYINTNEYQAALNALKKNQFTEAVRLTKSYVAIKPDDPRTHVLLLFSWLGTQEETNIQNHIRELEKKAPKIAVIVHETMASYFINKKRYYKAQTHIDALLKKEKTPETLFLQASILEKQGNLKEANTLYESIAANKPMLALLPLARVHLALRNYTTSLEYAQKHVNISANSIDGWMVLGTNYMIMGDLANAEKVFTRLNQLSENKHPLGLLNLAILQQSKQQLNKAQETYQKLLQQYPALEEGLLGLASVHLALNEPTKAATIIAKIKNKNDPLYHLVSATAAVLKNDIKLATHSYKKASGLYLDLNGPADSGVNSYLPEKKDAVKLVVSNFFYRQGYFQLVNNLIAASPMHDALLSLTYARSMWKIGDAQAAIDLYEKLRQKFPKLAAPLLEMAEIAYHKGEKKKAISLYENALKEFVYLDDMLLQIGNLYAEIGDVNHAVAAYTAYLQKHPNSAYALNQMASIVLEKNNDPGKALDFAQKAMHADPKNTYIKDTLASIYYAKGDHKNALKYYLEIDQRSQFENPLYFYRIAKIYLSSNNKKQAAQYFEQALNLGKDFPGKEDAKNQLKI